MLQHASHHANWSTERRRQQQIRGTPQYIVSVCEQESGLATQQTTQQERASAYTSKVTEMATRQAKPPPAISPPLSPLLCSLAPCSSPSPSFSRLSLLSSAYHALHKFTWDHVRSSVSVCSRAYLRESRKWNAASIAQLCPEMYTCTAGSVRSNPCAFASATSASLGLLQSGIAFLRASAS